MSAYQIEASIPNCSKLSDEETMDLTETIQMLIELWTRKKQRIEKFNAMIDVHFFCLLDSELILVLFPLSLLLPQSNSVRLLLEPMGASLLGLRLSETMQGSIWGDEAQRRESRTCKTL